MSRGHARRAAGSWSVPIAPSAKAVSGHDAVTIARASIIEKKT
ncbi:MAG TPA: hypothetical protein VGQ77_17390 [Methylomirabilota bacterium]|nr:hypothetical protein [Methylomirabilota bacterium]